MTIYTVRTLLTCLVFSSGFYAHAQDGQDTVRPVPSGQLVASDSSASFGTKPASPSNAQSDTQQISDLSSNSSKYPLPTWRVGLAYCYLNDLSLHAGIRLADIFMVDAACSGYSHQAGSLNEYRYRLAAELQCYVVREKTADGFVSVGLEWFRRSNSLYDDYVFSGSNVSYRNNVEPYVCIGGHADLYSGLSLMLAVYVDSYTFAHPETLYYLFYEPVVYPAFEIGLSFALPSL